MTTYALTPAQQRVVDHDGALRVVGAAGTGKTTALVHRYLRLAAEVGPGGVLVLARDRAAAQRFREVVLPGLHGVWDELPITTAWGLSFDVVARHAGADPPRLLRGAEQRSLVRRLLGPEAGDRRRWPLLHQLVGRPAFADEVATAVLDAQSALLDPARVRAAAHAHGGEPRWRELAGFFDRYLAALEAGGLVDGAGVLARAAAALDDPAAGAATAERYRHVLVDDHEVSGPAGRHLLGRLVRHGSAVSVATAAMEEDPELPGPGPVEEVLLDDSFRNPQPPRLVRCRHPSMEPEAVVGELLAARDRGVAWEDMAVLVRDTRRRATAITRALARHAIPVGHQPGQVSDEPTARALVDLLRWVNGDETALDRLLTSSLSRLDAAEVRRLRRSALEEGSPLARRPELAHLTRLRDELARHAAHEDVAALAHRAFCGGLGHLVREPGQAAAPEDERALDAVVSFLDGLTRLAERQPGARLADYLALADSEGGGELDPWVSGPHLPGAVTVTSVAASGGQEWDTVVVAGCVEGHLPRIREGLRFFDRAVLDEGAPPSPAERRRACLAEERRLFSVACTRATATLVGTAAPEPGVLLSRFLEGWPEEPARVAFTPDTPPPAPAPTTGAVPLWPGTSLRLSAGQLDTFEDCPLKHAYRHGLHVRSAARLHAGLGLLVHQVLARFLDPDGPPERTRERLHRVAAECWHDDLAPYRPQLEEARRDLYDMLDLWWDEEGSQGGGPDVLATERPFDVPVGPHRVRGRIDRVDRTDGGIRVVDYKSGKKRPRGEEVADDLQLATYHLAATRDPRLAAWGPPTEVRLLHLRSMTAMDQPTGPSHTGDTEHRILATAQRILDEEMAPAVDADCDHCELHRLCPLWPEGREVGQA